MRIMHVIDSGGLYGAEAILLSLMLEQEKQGLAPTLCSIGVPGEPDKPMEAEAENRRLHVLRLRMTPGPNPLGAWRLARSARRSGADIVHSHGYKGNILLGFAPRSLTGAPLVATLHGYTHAEGWGRMRLYQWADRRALERVDRVVLVHRGMLADPKLARRRDGRWCVIENGVPPADGDAPPPDENIARFCRGGFTIGAVGRLSREKGFGFLLDALADLLRGGFEARLVILGEGPERPALERRIAALQLGPRVLLPGYVAPLRSYLSLFGVFVQASLTEGLPVSLLQAMQQRVPIVATAVGGTADVLQQGRGGVLAPPADPAALERGIRSIAEGAALARALTDASFEEVATHYSSARMAAEYLDLYQQVLRLPRFAGAADSR